MESWVEGADGSGFGLENLPFGAVARPASAPRGPRCGSATHALMLDPLAEAGLLGDLPAGVLAGPVLNPFLALGRPAWSATRARLAELLRAGAPERRRRAALVPLAQVEPRLPLAIGDYVDFYSSLEHATNLGRMFRPDAEPLLPNWRHLPVGYHGRASSVVVSGTPVRRPRGQLPPAERAARRVRADRAARHRARARLRHRARQRARQRRSPTARGRDHVFGFVLVNDWSARDIQRWEYVPLGPFLGQVVRDLDLAVDRAAGGARAVPRAGARAGPGAARRTCAPTGDWALDIALEVELVPDGGEETVISRTNARGLYWTAPAAARPRDRQRHQRAPGRPLRVGHDLRARPGQLRAACSSSPGAAATRSSSPAASSAPSSRTATP